MLGHEAERTRVVHATELFSKILHEPAHLAVGDPFAEVMQARCVAMPFAAAVTHALDFVREPVPRRFVRIIGGTGDGETRLDKRDAIESSERNSKRLALFRISAGFDVSLESVRLVRRSDRKLADPNRTWTQRGGMPIHLLGSEGGGPRAQTK